MVNVGDILWLFLGVHILLWKHFDEIFKKQIFPISQSYMGIIIETPAFIPYYSGYKNLKYLADINRKIGKDEIVSSIINVGLDPDLKRSVRKYKVTLYYTNKLFV